MIPTILDINFHINKFFKLLIALERKHLFIREEMNFMLQKKKPHNVQKLLITVEFVLNYYITYPAGLWRTATQIL